MLKPLDLGIATGYVPEVARGWIGRGACQAIVVILHHGHKWHEHDLGWVQTRGVCTVRRATSDTFIPCCVNGGDVMDVVAKAWKGGMFLLHRPCSLDDTWRKGSAGTVARKVREYLEKRASPVLRSGLERKTGPAAQAHGAVLALFLLRVY